MSVSASDGNIEELFKPESIRKEDTEQICGNDDMFKMIGPTESPQSLKVLQKMESFGMTAEGQQNDMIMILEHSDSNAQQNQSAVGKQTNRTTVSGPDVPDIRDV